jgi:integrase
MKVNKISSIIQQALTILENEVGLAESSLRVVASRSFKPISDYFNERFSVHYDEVLINELDDLYLEKLQTGVISRNVYNLRIRGTRILREVYATGSFVWKGPACKSRPDLPVNFERIMAGLSNAISSETRSRDTLYIVRRFLLLLTSSGIDSIAQIGVEHLQMFLSEMSQTRAKGMEDVIGALRKLHRYLIEYESLVLPYVGLLMAPRARDRKIYPYMPQEDLDAIIRSIDSKTAIGKRDYAILMLAASSGIRAGDIATIRLSDVDWRKSEIHIVQGKTQVTVILPLNKGAGAALADYILNGRPESKSPEIFLRSLAPYQGFKDGTSVACVLRRRMKSAGVSHTLGDGKTMHGIRRMLGTEMTIKGVPVTTIAQILGHQSDRATKQYISLDIEGLRECALGFDSILEGPRQ